MIRFVDNHVEATKELTRFKKITGTRLGALLGVNRWKTPFQIWLELTKIYEPPFEDTIYTVIGKALEPKQLRYLKETYFEHLKTPTDIYGENAFKKTYGNFYKDKVFGGMWDALIYDDNNEKPIAVVEAKTTKRAEDWMNGKMPEHYAIQAALYATLSGVDDVYMLVSFPNESVYLKAQELLNKKDIQGNLEEKIDFVPSIQNTIIFPFKVSERYPNFNVWLEECRDFYENSVKKGISPDFDVVKDKETLKVLREMCVPESNDDTKKLIKDFDILQKEIDEAKAQIADKEKEYKQKKELLKKAMIENGASVYVGNNYKFTISKTTKSDIDKKALEEDGLLEKYSVPKETITFRVAKNQKV